jgi:hypothetical protein
MFEEVIINLAAMKGFVRTRQGEGGRAIMYLVGQGCFPLRMAVTTFVGYGISFKLTDHIQERLRPARHSFAYKL